MKDGDRDLSKRQPVARLGKSIAQVIQLEHNNSNNNNHSSMTKKRKDTCPSMAIQLCCPR